MRAARVLTFMNGKIWFLAVLTVSLTAGMQADAAEKIAVRNLDGTRQTIPNPASKATVLIFAAHDCPISNQYAPEIRRIYDAYKPRGVAFDLIYAEAKLTPTAAKTHKKSFGYKMPAMIDGKFALAKKWGATATPEAVVLSPKNEILYRGRIDDLYFDFGQRRASASSPDLRRALDAVLSGKPVAKRFTKVIGCFIPTE